MNRLYLGLIPMLLGVVLISFFMIQDILGGTLVTLSLVSYFLALLLSRKGKHVISRWLATLPVILTLDILTCLYGRAAGGSVAFLVIGMGVVILFDKTTARAFLLGLLFFSFLFTEWFLLTYGVQRPSDYLVIFPPIAFAACFSTMIAIMMYFEEDFQRFRRETKGLLATLQEHNKSLLQANYELAHFAHTTSQHFKGPLKNITSLLGLMERRLSALPLQAAGKFIDLLKNDARHLYQLIEDILFYARVDQHNDPEQLTPTRLYELMSRIEGNLRDVVRSSGGIIRWEGAEMLNMNPPHAELLIQNLVQNGLKYNDSDSPWVLVTLQTLPGGEQVISVKDNGIGIAPEYHGQIFHMFSRLHSRDEFEGTGIGLAVCRKIVQLYNGTIEVMSEGHGGTEFLIKLPPPSREVRAPVAEATAPVRQPLQGSNAWQWLSGKISEVVRYGVEPDMSWMEVHSLMLYNRMNLVVILAMSLLCTLDLIIGDIFGFAIGLSILLACAGSISLIKRGYFRYVKSTNVVLVSILIGCLNLMFGKDSGGELTLLGIGLSSIIFFPTWRARIPYLIVITLIYYGGYILGLTMEIAPDLSKTQLVYLIVFSTNFIVMISMMSFFSNQEIQFEQEMSELMQNLHSKNEDLLEANHDLSQFAYAASHHLKSPLKNISSLLGLIERKLPESVSAQIHHLLQLAKADSVHLYRLVEDILAYSRIDTSMQSKTISEEELQHILQRVEGNLREELGEQMGTIRWTDLVPVMANESHLELMIQVLVKNGLEYNESEHPRVVISGRVTPEGWTLLEVTDNGIGIQEEYQDQIFEMFARLHTQEKFKGTGIGLTICRRIMTTYSGYVTVNSAPGEGATFSLMFPPESFLEKSSSLLESNSRLPLPVG